MPEPGSDACEYTTYLVKGAIALDGSTRRMLWTAVREECSGRQCENKLIAYIPTPGEVVTYRVSGVEGRVSNRDRIPDTR